ncbi:hypothetical protein ACHAWO_004315 [Cyclotella atomus]|uniref:Uncharacterized protein n=1 Tax=Cyclotella atomus TaxID=382360 RepID=A0ABD3QR92_9STRA
MGNALISKILFQPPSPPNALNYHGSNLNVSYIWIYSANGTLIPALHVTHPPSDHSIRYGTAASAGKYTLLYSHGNAEDLGLIAHFLTDLARLLGVDVLCYDYAGYGVSTDKVAVSCFLREYGEELDGWKAARALRREQGCETSSEESIFVAPMVYPSGMGDEFDFVDEMGEDGDDGNSSCLGSCDGDAGVMYKQCEEEEDAGGYFANACGVANYEPEPDGRTIEERLYHRSNVQRMHERRPLPRRGANDQFVSAKVKRRNLLANHSWTPPASSEQQCYNDIQSAFEYLTQVKGIIPKNILMYGKSVGSGPTCWLAQKLCTESRLSPDGVSTSEGREEYNVCDGRPISSSRAPGGVILHSPFLSVIRVVLDMGFTGIGDLFPNVDRVNDFTCPVYIIHGTQDEIVPFYHGEALFNLIPDSSRTVPFWARGAGHNNIEMEMPTAYIKRLQQFIRQCDRILYPAQKLATTSPAFQLANPSLSPQMINSPSWAANTNMSASIYQLTSNELLVQEQKNVNKQRKQRGTLVMKSTHNSKPQMSYPSTMSAASRNAEWQQQQKQRLMMEQCRQKQLRIAQQYLAQNAPGQKMMGQYHRTNSVPMIRSPNQQVGGNVYQRE